MKMTHLAVALAGAVASSMILAPAAVAQTAAWPLGSELAGATAQVQFADGIVNTVTFNADGTATIQGPGVTVPGRWFVQDRQLCIEATGARECWPYAMAWQDGRTMTLTSDCASTSSWTASNVAQPPAPPRRGERG
jgi:hypothetical protein